MVSSGDGKLGTDANGGGDFLTYLNQKQQNSNIKVPDGKGVYTDVNAYITLTYYIVVTNDIAIMSSSRSSSSPTTTTAAATTTAAPATLDIYFTAPASSSVNEGDSGTTTHGVTVTRSNGTGVATVRWYTADDTAIANTDYVSAYGTLTFQASVTTLQINITINGDVTLEGHEAFKVYLDDGSGGLNTTAPTWEIGGVTQSTPSITTNLHTVTITNDDVETKFVDGSIPDWIQPIYYETSAGIINAGDISNSASAYPSPNVILFDAWCAPTAAACQLGHLNSTGLVLPAAASGHVDGISDLMNAGDHDNPTHGIAGTGTKTWDSAVGWGDYLVDGPNVRAAKNAMEGWYDYTGVGGTSCKLTDFGWFMNTNDSSQDGAVAGTRVTAGTATAPNVSNLINLNGLGTRIHNIYLGIKDFYRHAGYSNMVGIVYHRAGDGTVPSFPSGQTHPISPLTPEPPIGILPRYWIDTGTPSSSRAGVDEVMTWETIKTEIDQNRTVIACLQGWNVSQSSRSVAAGFPNTTHSIESAYIAGAGGPNGSGYWSLDTTNNGVGFDNTNYTADDSTDPPIWGGTALGHTVLIIGYIAKGALDDISLEKDTDWLIVRDNHENTSRNVIIPYKSDDPNSTNATNVETIRWAKDVILATVYVDQTQATYVAASPTCPHSGDGTSNPYGGTTTTTTAAAGGNNYHVTHCDGVTGTVVIDDQYGAGPVQIGDFVAWTDFSAMPYCGEVTAVDQGGTPDGSLADSTDYGDCDTCCGTHMGGPC
jgi:hypothetical protein